MAVEKLTDTASTASKSRPSKEPAISTKTLNSRTQMIDVALKMILEHGIDALRIDDVVEEVGVTKGSLYWHFEDRNGLVKAALAEHIRRFSAETVSGMSDAISHSSEKDDYLAQIIPFIIDPFDKKQVRARWGRLGVLVETQNDPELRAMMNEVQSRHLDVVVELMTDAQQKGFLREDLDPRSVAVALSVINLGSNIIDVLGDSAPEPAAWWHMILFFVNAMFPGEN
jgi:AcrR family transcriptional regulator